MFTDPAPGEVNASALAEAYLAELATIVADLEDGTVEPTVKDAIAAEELETITIGDAAAIYSTTRSGRDPEAIQAELRDRLLIEMSNAVLDVDRLAAAMERDLDGKELQQRIEGRAPMTLGEFAYIRHAIATAGQ